MWESLGSPAEPEKYSPIGQRIGHSTGSDRYSAVNVALVKQEKPGALQLRASLDTARGISKEGQLSHPADYDGFLSTVQTEAQSAPPTLKVAVTLGSFLWISFGAVPFNCQKQEPSIATPVAPTGWPFAISPPDILMAQSPSTLALPSIQ